MDVHRRERRKTREAAIGRGLLPRLRRPRMAARGNAGRDAGRVSMLAWMDRTFRLANAMGDARSEGRIELMLPSADGNGQVHAAVGRDQVTFTFLP